MAQPLRAASRGLHVVGHRSVPAWDSIEIHLQPIIDVATGSPFAVEALSRFPALRGQSPEAVFAGAHASGHGVELEAACLRAALAARDRLPSDLQLTVNVSPDVLTHPLVTPCWTEDLGGVIIEVTENRASSPIQLSDEL